MLWGYKGDTLCSFCRGSIEGREHLFFHCNFSQIIWKEMMRRCEVVNPMVVWDDVVDCGIVGLKGNVKSHKMLSKTWECDSTQKSFSATVTTATNFTTISFVVFFFFLGSFFNFPYLYPYLFLFFFPQFLSSVITKDTEFETSG